jgi:hypothetical protein
VQGVSGLSLDSDAFTFVSWDEFGIITNWDIFPVMLRSKYVISQYGSLNVRSANGIDIIPVGAGSLIIIA